jgi:hypothetical protein
LKGMEEELPSGPVSAEEGSALQQLRGKAELEESQGRGRVFHGGSAAPWTVLFEPGGKPEVSCLNRTVKVIPVGAVADILPSLEPWRSHLQTVGVAGLGGETGGSRGAGSPRGQPGGGDGSGALAASMVAP